MDFLSSFNVTSVKQKIPFDAETALNSLGVALDWTTRVAIVLIARSIALYQIAAPRVASLLNVTNERFYEVSVGASVVIGVLLTVLLFSKLFGSGSKKGSRASKEEKEASSPKKPRSTLSVIIAGLRTSIILVIGFLVAGATILLIDGEGTGR